MDDAAAVATASLLIQEAGNLPYDIPVEEVFPSSLPRQWRDFKRSGPPKNIGMIENERIFPPIPCLPASVTEAFAAGNPVAEFFETSGTRVILDFLHKVWIRDDAKEATKRAFPFYWVDADERFFMSARLGRADEASVRRAFYGPSQGRLAIKEVRRRCQHREVLIMEFLRKMVYHRGSWLFGWYGASPAEVEEVADGGEVPANWQLVGAELAHGRGIHVSALDCLEASTALSLMSAKDQPAQVVFCALALGPREIVPAGSSQSEPSSSFFHTGTDSLSKPKWHVFWESSAGTRTLPLYTVTFSRTAAP